MVNKSHQDFRDFQPEHGGQLGRIWDMWLKLGTASFSFRVGLAACRDRFRIPGTNCSGGSHLALIRGPLGSIGLRLCTGFSSLDHASLGYYDTEGGSIMNGCSRVRCNLLTAAKRHHQQEPNLLTTIPSQWLKRGSILSFPVPLYA